MATAQEDVAALAAEVRKLKARLTDKGVASSEINKHPQVQAAVQALQERKAKLSRDDPAADEAESPVFDVVSEHLRHFAGGIGREMLEAERAVSDVEQLKTVEVLATEVRELKARLAAGGFSASKINKDPRVLAAVQALREQKAKLSSDDPATDEAFFARQQAEKQASRQREKAEAARQASELKAAEARAPRPLTQRKIFHLFRYTGSGPTFRYEPPPRLNAEQTGFGEGDVPRPAVYVTEKWDGTTMQATSRHIFKRLDVWGKRRDGQDPSQRYDLRLLAWRGEDTGGEWRGLDFADADARVAAALRPHLAALAALPEGLCAYFEVVHTEINATFRHLPGFADVRVFDFSRDGCGFLPFEDAVRLASEANLPIVGWTRRDNLCEEELWQELADAAASGRQYGTAAGALEGYVVREAGSGSRVAKARVEQVVAGNSLGREDDPPPSGVALPAARPFPPSWDLAHLEALGLCPRGLCEASASRLGRPG